MPFGPIISWFVKNQCNKVAGQLSEVSRHIKLQPLMRRRSVRKARVEGLGRLGDPESGGSRASQSGPPFTTLAMDEQVTAGGPLPSISSREMPKPLIKNVEFAF